MKSLLPHQCHRSCTAFHLLVPAASCIPSWLHTYLPLFTGPPHPCHTLLPSLVWQLGYYFSPKESQASRDVLITPLQASWAVWQRETLEAGLPSMRRAPVRTVGFLYTWMDNSAPGLEEPNAMKRLLCCLALVGSEGERGLAHALSQGWLPDSSPGHFWAGWERSKRRIVCQKGLFWQHKFPGINHSKSRRCSTAQTHINITENVFLVQRFRYLQRISASFSLP